MKYYKTIKDGKVLDVIKSDEIVFLKWQERYDRMVFCNESEAQAIFSSDRKHIWHEISLYNIPDGSTQKYDTVDLVEIDVYEYENLKILNLKTPEEIIDSFVMSLIQGGVV